MARKAKNKPQPDDLLQDAEPPSINPYEILGVDEKATADEVKTAYRKQALKHHPDKAPADKKDESHKKFQEIAFAYAILSDERRRRRYDLTGNTAETLADESDSEFNWTDFYREQYSAAVDASAIEKIKTEYQGSDKEKRDILAAYEMHEGDMDGVFEEVMLSSVLDDEDRFRKIIKQAIKDGEVQNYDKFSKESPKKRKQRVEHAKREEKEALELAKELGVEDKLFGSPNGKGKGKKNKEDGEDALKALIQQRQRDRGRDFLANLEAKYAPKPKKRASEKAAEGSPKKRKQKA